AMRRRIVDLPQPDGPSSTRNSPMSRPSGAYSSTISRLMSRRASTCSPPGPVNVRETLRSVILFFGSMGGRNGGLGHLPGRALPREQPGFERGEQPPEQESRHPDRDNARVHALEIEHFARGLHHVADSLSRVHHFGQNHVSPTDVIEDAERAEDSGE